MPSKFKYTRTYKAKDLPKGNYRLLGNIESADNLRMAYPLYRVHYKNGTEDEYNDYIDKHPTELPEVVVTPPPPIQYYSQKLKDILSRSLNDGVASNYSEAIDLNSWIGKLGPFKGFGDDTVEAVDYISNFIYGEKKIPTGLSNCTLTATQWVDPKTPISRALTIIDNGMKYGYVEIPELYVIPSDLVIATNPRNNAHHTMLVHDFTTGLLAHNFYNKNYLLPKGHPLVRYSTGTTHPSGFRKSVGLMEYIDNSEGKTNIKYYRHYDPYENETLLPEVMVTPNKTYVPEGLKITYIKRNE